jgi:hypothetical protein
MRHVPVPRGRQRRRDEPHLARSLAVVALLTLGACASGPTENPRPLELAGNSELEVGDTVHLAVYRREYPCLFCPSNTYGVSGAVWTVEPRAVALVEQSIAIPARLGPATSGVVVRAVAPGRATVSAKSTGVSGSGTFLGSLPLRVLPRILSFVITPNAGDILVGDTLKVVCRVVYEGGAREANAVRGCFPTGFEQFPPVSGPSATAISRGDTTWIIGLAPGRASMTPQVAKRTESATFTIRAR